MEKTPRKCWKYFSQTNYQEDPLWTTSVLVLQFARRHIQTLIGQVSVLQTELKDKAFLGLLMKETKMWKKPRLNAKDFFSTTPWLQRCVPDTRFVCEAKSWSSNSQGISTNSTLQPHLLPKIFALRKTDTIIPQKHKPLLHSELDRSSCLWWLSSPAHSPTCPTRSPSHLPLLQLHHPHSPSAAGDKGNLYLGFFQHFSLDHFSNLETCTCFSLDMNALSVFAPQTASFHSNFTRYSWKWNLDIYHWGNGGKHTVTLAVPTTASLGIL